MAVSCAFICLCLHSWQVLLMVAWLLRGWAPGCFHIPTTPARELELLLASIESARCHHSCRIMFDGLNNRPPYAHSQKDHRRRWQNPNRRHNIVRFVVHDNTHRGREWEAANAERHIHNKIPMNRKNFQIEIERVDIRDRAFHEYNTNTNIYFHKALVSGQRPLLCHSQRILSSNWHISFHDESLCCFRRALGRKLRQNPIIVEFHFGFGQMERVRAFHRLCGVCVWLPQMRQSLPNFCFSRSSASRKLCPFSHGLCRRAD